MQASTITQGASQVAVTKEVKVAGQHGGDLMDLGRIGATKSFLSSLSLPILKMDPRKEWTADDVKVALGVITQASRLNINVLDQVESFDPDQPNSRRDDDPFVAEGRRLALLTEDGLIASPVVDFGTVSVRGETNGGEPTTDAGQILRPG